MNSILTITENHLPRDFKNTMLESKSSEQVIIRSSVQNIEEIKSWVAVFSLHTNTKWNAETSNPNGKAMVCRKRYVCHHSDFQKVSPEENKRGSSKNTACKAKLNCKIKKSTPDTRKKDLYVKQGLCAIITIDLVHNHALSSAEASYSLPASEDVRQRFTDHFNAGMGIAESMKHHRGLLALEDDSDMKLTNSRFNPTYRTVRYWHDNWRKLNSGSGAGDGLFEKLREKEKTDAKEVHTVKFSESPFAVVVLTHPELTSDTDMETNTKRETGSAISEDENEESKKALQESVIELLSKKLSTIQHSRNDLHKLKQRLENISTEGQLSSFLCTAGSYNIALQRKSEACVQVQPTTKGRRKATKRISSRVPKKIPVKVAKG